MASRAAQEEPKIISEDDDAPKTATSKMALLNGQDRPQPRVAETDSQDEFVAIDADEAPQEREATLSEAEGGEKPLIEQPEDKVYTRSELAAMTPEQRQQLWDSLPRQDRAIVQRQLYRAIKKDKRAKGQDETARLRGDLGAMSSEIQDLRAQLAQFGPRLSNIDRARVQDQMADLDRQIAAAGSELADINKAISDAILAQDNQSLIAAMERRENTAIKRYELNTNKKALTDAINNANRQGERASPQEREAPQPQPRQRPAPQLAPAAQSRVDEFMAEHPWYDPRAHLKPNGDLDSVTLSLIDKQVADEGYDPASDDYWDEVEDRAAERLPWRFGAQPRQTAARPQPQPRQQQQTQSQRRGPMTGGNGEGAPKRGEQIEVRLDAERKKALVLAGALDMDGKTVLNRQKFKNYLKQYDKFDRENGTAVRQ